MFLGINKAKLSDTKLASLTSDSELDEPGCSDKDKGKFGADIISMHHDKYGSQKSSRLFVVPNPQSTFAHGYDLPSDMAMLKSDMKLVAHERDREATRMDSHKQAESQGRRSMGATGVSSSDKTLSSRRDYERLKTQCDSAMRELQALRRQHGETVRKCETAMKESEYYRMQNKVTVAKLDQNQLETLALRSQYNEVVAEKHRLDQEVVNLQKFCEEDRKEVSELRRQQQESMNDSGNSETINQMYIAAVRKHEAIKDDYDSLRKLYADVFASHAAAAGKLELTQEELARLKKQSEEIIQERNSAIRERNGLKQQCTEAIRQWDTALRERNEAKEALIKVQQQRDEAMKDINQAMAVRLKASKDLARLTEERNAAVQEYSLIMSERDSVHKEIEKLQEELSESSKKTKTLETQKKVSFEEVETLQREIASALHDRDRAIKQCHELREKYGDYDTTIGDSSIESQEQPKDYEYYHRDRNVASQSRNDVLDHTGNGEGFSKTKKERVDNLDQANQEIDRLRKQVEKLQTELSEASQEAEVSKRRRDWAFSERDKIVQERESIRTLCDKLRRERDRAVSDLAEALRDSDDIKKQRNEASKELKELREKIESRLEKESRIKHLHSLGHNHSRDSAIDADLQEWETETLEFDIGATSDGEVGFELSGGKDDPQFPDSPIYVCNVVKGSPADGKLRINDCVVLVNSSDLTCATRSTALEAVRTSGGVINMVVRRRRLTSSRFIQSVHLNISGNKEHGLSLETGVYVNKIAPGSVAAKEGNLALGDRVISVNGRSLDGFRFGVEAMKLLDLSGDNLVLSLLKCVNPPSAPLSSSSSGHNIQDNDVDKHSCSPKSYSVANRSPLRDGSLSRGNGGGAAKEPVKKLTTSSSQTEDVVVNLPTSPAHNLVNGVSCDDSASSEKSCEHGGNGCQQQQQQPALPPPPPQTFLDKFFGERRSSTKEHKSKKFSWASTPLQEEEAIAELDSVIDYCKKSCATGKSSGSGTGKSRKKRASDKASEAAKSLGTWPKYRGPPLEYLETVPGTMTHSRRKRERVSIASLLSTPKLPAAMYAEGKKQQEREHERERLRERREREIERERGGGRDLDVERSSTGTRRSSAGNGSLADRERAFAALYKSEGGLPPQIASSGHGSLPPGVLQSMKGHFLPGPKCAYPQSSDVQMVGGGKGPAGSGLYSTSSSLEFPLDYSVVSANRDKEVLEYYKSRARPKSAMYLPSERERFSSPDGSAPAKPSGLDLHALVGHLSRGELSPSDHLLGMSPRLSDREAAALLHHGRGGSGQPSASSYVAHPSSSASPSDNFPTYYTVSQGRMAHNNHVAAGNFHSSVVYSQHGTGLTSASSSSSAGVGSPSPRYSSPPYMSRSGESLLGGGGGGSIPEGAFHPPPLMPPSMDARAYHRYVMNQSPGLQHYPGYGHSPSHSMELPHFHPVAAGSAKRGSSSSSSNAVMSIPAYRGDVALMAIPAYRGDVAGFGSYDGPAAVPKRPPYRIRIPSNQSVTSKSSAGKVSTGSIERGECCRRAGDSSGNRWRVSGVLASDVVVSPSGSVGGKLWSSPPPPPPPRSSSASISDRGSPMPAFRVETVTPGGTIVPRSLADFQNKKPAHGELRNIRIDKTAEETLGIQIDCGSRGGIFVSQVTENSLAQQAGIHIGDQLLEVCGINLRSATYSLAANVLRQCGDSITIKVQYNHEKCREVLGIGGSSSSEGSPIQTPTPRSSPKSRSPPQQLLDMDDSLPASATSTLKRQDTLVGQVSRKSAKEAQMGGDMYAPRYVFLKMATSDLGITFLGGNAVGIFVHKVQSDSPASGPNGLRCGDQILEYNGIDLKHATAEQAAYELAKRAETVTILSQFNIDRYNEIQHLPGDSFFIRAMFDHQAENPNELSFRKDDILFVDNTMFNGVSGLWRAWVVDEDGHKKQCGVIPSKYKVEEELLLKRSLGELDSDSGSRRSASTSASSARRSFFRRYRKHQRSNSRDSKELASFSDISINSFSDSGTLIEDPAILTYQRVERLNDLMLRPVLLLGPLIDTVVDKLVQDFPRKFVRCVPEVVNASEQSMEEGVLENLYIDYRRRGSHYECLTLSTVRDMCDEVRPYNCHCIVDVSPAAVERLHRNQIYPVVLFIKFKSTKQIREVKDPRLCLEKVTTKAAKEMYEHALRLESEYKHLISATIPGGNLAYMCSQIEAQVEQEQNKVLWVPTGNI